MPPRNASATAAEPAAQTDLTDAAADTAPAADAAIPDEQASADAAAAAPDAAPAADAAASEPPAEEVTRVKAVALFGFGPGIYPGVIVEGSAAAIKVLVANGDADDAPSAVLAAANAGSRVIEV